MWLCTFGCSPNSGHAHGTEDERLQIISKGVFVHEALNTLEQSILIHPQTEPPLSPSVIVLDSPSR